MGKNALSKEKEQGCQPCSFLVLLRALLNRVAFRIEVRNLIAPTLNFL